jgi:hypothetical protein
MRKTLLFVTYHDEDCGAGLSYAIDLAKTMNKGMTVLLIYKRNLMERFADVMTSVTFAEAGEHETAKRIYAGGDMKNDRPDKRMSLLAERCRGSGVDVNVQSAAIDIVQAVKHYLSEKTSVDMVLLSPSVTYHGNITEKDLRRLVNTASRPIVTMARQTQLSAEQSCL